MDIATFGWWLPYGQEEVCILSLNMQAFMFNININFKKAHFTYTDGTVH